MRDYFRGWDVGTCARRIQASSASDLPALKLALQRESVSCRPRSRLVARMRSRIAALEKEVR